MASGFFTILLNIQRSTTTTFVILLFLVNPVFTQESEYCTFGGQITQLVSTQLDEQVFPKGVPFHADDCTYYVKVLSISSNSATIILHYNNNETEQLVLYTKEPKKLSDGVNSIVLMDVYPSTDEVSISLTNSEEPDICVGGTCPICEGEDKFCYAKGCPTTGYEPMPHLPCNSEYVPAFGYVQGGVCCKRTSGITTEKVYTGKNEYSQGDYIDVFVELPYAADSCEFYLITPQGDEMLKGEGSCGPYDTYDPPRVNEHKIFENIDYTSFYSFAPDYLSENYGRWGIKINVKKDEKIIKTLTTNFDYVYKNKIFGTCTLIDERTKSCDFLGTEYLIEYKGGCGITPVYLKINYNGETKNLVVGNEAVQLHDDIFIKNVGTPCSVFRVNLVFENLLDQNDTQIRIALIDNRLKTKLADKTIEVPLPAGEDGRILEAKVTEGEIQKEISLALNDQKNTLVIESNNISAETQLPVSINGSRLYVESKEEEVEINVLPDTAFEKVRAELDSVQNLEIISGSVIYLAKGLKNGEYREVKLDGTTGQIIKEQIKEQIDTAEVLPTETKNETETKRGTDRHCCLGTGIGILIIVGIVIALIKYTSEACS